MQTFPCFKLHWTYGLIFINKCIQFCFFVQAAAIGGQEGATVVRDQGAAVTAPSYSTDCLSADPAPTFELKGLNFLSASPLGSGETSADVYNSGKLNFL